MTNKDAAKITLTAGAAAAAQADSAAVNQALETLKTYDWGDDNNALKPIDQAIVAAQGDAAALKPLENKLLALLAAGISRSALDYVCRKLRVIGTADSVAALAALLPDEKASHIARYALERIPDDRAADAIRDALPKVGGRLKVGMISSLGTRRDEKSIAIISKSLGDSDTQIAKAAAQSLGLIATPAAAGELRKFVKKASADMKISAGDACLACAERLLADGQRAEASTLYKELSGADQPSRIKAAATKGMLTAATRR